jgi:hypothetical protein
MRMQSESRIRLAMTAEKGTPRFAVGNSYAPLDVMQFTNVPSELQDRKRFVCWRQETRNEKPTKVPVDPHTGDNAESNDPATWGTLDEAVAYYQTHSHNLQGVGRMFDLADGIIGVDFDHCLDDQGNMISGTAAAEWLPQLNSYSEISPSGRGVKVWVKAYLDLDGKTGRRDAQRGIEIYQERRYFTITGRRLLQFSANVEERQSVVEALYRAVFSPGQSAFVRPISYPLPVLDDAEIIWRARKARNGAKFRALWGGDLNGSGSQSEADVALCSILWFWSGNRETVRRLFSESALGQREKWTKRPALTEALPALAAGVIQAQVATRHGLRVGVMAILHTFNGKLEFNSHVHTMVTGGGLHDSYEVWVPDIVYDKDALMRSWRRAIIAILRAAAQAGQLVTRISGRQLEQLLDQQEKRWWSINIQSFEDKQHFLKYAGRYTRRPPIAERRITLITEGTVRFWYKDKRRRCKVEVQCSKEEFIERWAQHILDRYKHSVRSFGLFAPRTINQTTNAIFAVFGQKRRPRPKSLSWDWLIKHTFGRDPRLDSKGNRMKWVRRISPKPIH